MRLNVKVRLDSTGEEVDNVPATRVTDRHLSIYWRLLRPEFVKGDAETMAYRVRNTVCLLLNVKSSRARVRAGKRVHAPGMRVFFSHRGRGSCVAAWSFRLFRGLWCWPASRSRLRWLLGWKIGVPVDECTTS